MGAGAIKVGDSLESLPFYSKELQSSEGKAISLAEFKGQKPVVLFFFPKAHTGGCTKEVCAFRDAYNQFQEAGAQVLGISSDAPDQLKNFKEAQRAQYPFLSDAGGEVRKALGVKGNLLNLVPGRETFVISKEGKLLLRFNDQLHFKKHAAEALRALGVTPAPPSASSTGPPPTATTNAAEQKKEQGPPQAQVQAQPAQ